MMHIGFVYKLFACNRLKPTRLKVESTYAKSAVHLYSPASVSVGAGYLAGHERNTTKNQTIWNARICLGLRSS